MMQQTETKRLAYDSNYYFKVIRFVWSRLERRKDRHFSNALHGAINITQIQIIGRFRKIV